MHQNQFKGRQQFVRPRHPLGMRRRQGGMTFIGVLCLLGLVGVIAYAGLRLVPLYLNYMKVARSMEATAAEFKSDNADPGAIRHALDKHWQIEDISGVEAKEVEVVKDDG